VAKKKAGSLDLQVRRGLIEPSHPELSIVRQCKLINLHRSSYYFQAATESPENLEIMRLIDEKYTRHPFYGSRKLVPYLKENGWNVNRKRVLRLMRLMGISPVYPKPNLSKPEQGHKIYPYLLRDLPIVSPDQVWSTDITYIPMRGGFVYLTAIIDWFSRFVLAFELSNSLDSMFCIRALLSALEISEPVIFNTDQGSQFTSLDFTSVLKDRGIKISMDGKGRAIDNVFIERLWRSVKYELIYLKEFDSVPLLYDELRSYFRFYNIERHHQAIGNRRPVDLYPLDRYPGAVL
jgi:putative transposase